MCAGFSLGLVLLDKLGVYDLVEEKKARSSEQDVVVANVFLKVLRTTVLAMISLELCQNEL